MDEAKQRYDRQIRVWGKEAQHRLVTSRALLCGLSHLNVEVAKNLVLAGCNVCIQDDRRVECSDVGVNFFLDHEAVLANKIVDAVLPGLSALNSLCKIEVETRPVEELPDTFFLSFDLVSYSGNSEASALRLDALCRRRSPCASFFWSMAFGQEALFLSDLGPSFEYQPDPSMSAQSQAAAPATRTLQFSEIKDILSVHWVDMRSRLFPLSPTLIKSRLVCQLSEQLGREISAYDAAALQELYRALAPTQGLSAEEAMALLSQLQLQELCRLAQVRSIVSCSILGSTLAQEIVKAITHVGMPGRGVFVFSASDMVVRCIPVGPQ